MLFPSIKILQFAVVFHTLSIYLSLEIETITEAYILNRFYYFLTYGHHYGYWLSFTLINLTENFYFFVIFLNSFFFFYFILPFDKINCIFLL